MEVYANNRDTEQDTKWKNHNEINNTHFETQMFQPVPKWKKKMYLIN